MSVELMPPFSMSYGRLGDPLKRGPRYVRTRNSNRWHRVRSGVLLPPTSWRPEPRKHWTVWCGPGLWNVITRDKEPTDAPVCGTCEGRARGADGAEPGLIFSPRWQTPPVWCPGSGVKGRTLFIPLDTDWRLGKCLACGATERIRAGGGSAYYSGYAVLQKHAPAELVDPCPFHAWQYLANVDGRCACGACTYGRVGGLR